MSMTDVGLIFGVYLWKGDHPPTAATKPVDLTRQVWVQQWVMLLHGHAVTDDFLE